MQDILGRIIENKYRDLSELRSAYKLGCFEKTEKNRVSLTEKLKVSDQIQLIAEIKRGSPSKGLFAPDLDVAAQAKLYEKSGAAAISVLTDQKFFYGGFHDLQTVREEVCLPILCKDFIVDELQIDIAKSLGANLILLIVAAHSPSRLKELLAYAKGQDLEVLVEVHNETELAVALSLNHSLIGINNRNLKTFETSIEVSLKLIKSVDRPHICFVSESGIKNPEDVERLAQAGFKGVLVGESLIRDGLGGHLSKAFTKVVCDR
jgi:indole-3-glycerol phosphate synthase